MKQKSLILSSLLLAAFVIDLDTTIVNVALPTLVRELHTSDSQLPIGRGYVQPVVRGVGATAAGSLSDPVRAEGDAARGLSVFGLASLAAR